MKTKAPPLKRKFQIRYCNSKGHGHFKYFEVGPREKIEELAEISANTYLYEQRDKDKEQILNPFHMDYKPPKTLHVWEWDIAGKCEMKGGYRFKLQYSYLKGRTNANKWIIISEGYTAIPNAVLPQKKKLKKEPVK